MPLSEDQLREFKRRLELLKRRYSAALKGSSEEVKIGDGSKSHSQHQADQGTDDFDIQISIELSGKELQTLYQIERALEKMEEGTYGLCDLTNEEIPLNRLEAIPYATMTVAAQDKLEKGLLK
jgi:DnaK suppressor protein